MSQLIWMNELREQAEQLRALLAHLENCAALTGGEYVYCQRTLREIRQHLKRLERHVVVPSHG